MADWQKVKSSNIEAVMLEGGELHVRFIGGVEWKYPGVSQKDYDALLAAKSVGGHFYQHVKPLGGVRVGGDAKKRKT